MNQNPFDNSNIVLDGGQYISDRIHQHNYPDQHPGYQYGAVIRDVDTRSIIGRVEIGPNNMIIQTPGY